MKTLIAPCLLLVCLAGCASPSAPPVASPPAAGLPPASRTPLMAPATRATPTRPASVATSDELVLSKESLVASKSEAPNGSVIVRKVISTETVSVPVSLRTESYEIVRSGPNGQSPDFTPKEIRVDLSKEVAGSVVQAQVVEVVKLNKVIGAQDSSVSAQVRSESVEVIKP